MADRALWDDEHAICPFCDGVMDRDNTGVLVCQPCSTDALDAAEHHAVSAPTVVYGAVRS